MEGRGLPFILSQIMVGGHWRGLSSSVPLAVSTSAQLHKSHLAQSPSVAILRPLPRHLLSVVSEG